MCILIVLLIGVGTITDTDAQCDGHFIADVYIFHLFENREAILKHTIEILLLQDKNIFILLQFINQSIHRRDIVADLSIDQRCQQ